VNSNALEIFRKYNSTPDEEWKEIIRKSAIDPMVDGIAFPLVPDEATQCHFAGATLARNVHVGYQYYKAVKDTYESRIRAIDEETKLLDVGSGWGRVIRFFMKDIVPANLSGCDVSPWSIEICNACFKGDLEFQLIDPLPPTLYGDDHFDIIEGCSVFTHLSYYAVVLWMHEYFRILKPGGLLAMSVWKQSRFDSIRKLQRGPHISPEADRYQHRLQSSFSSNCELEEDLYKEAGMVYIPYSSDPAVTYGEAFISPDSLADHWSPFFEHLTNFELDGYQQIVFLRKKADFPKIDGERLQETARVAKMFDIQSILVNSYIQKMKSPTCEEQQSVGDFNVVGGTLKRGKCDLILTSDKEKTAVAIKKIEASFKKVLTVKGRMKSALPSGIRNGFVALTGNFGDKNQQQVRAGILMGRMMFTIDGDFVEQVEKPQLFDQDKTFDFELTVNFKERTVSFSVDGQTVISRMTEVPLSITHIGFIASNTKTEFGEPQISGE
jgi:ubiquinone/menaquinone biosynthesis C-methylase UbiE